MASIEIQNSENDVSYQLRRESDDLEVGEAVLGDGGTITLYFNPVTTTTFNILATSTIDFSTAELSNKSTVTVHSKPRLGITYNTTNIPVFSDRYTFTTNGGAYDFEIVDFNNDGYLDVIYSFHGLVLINLGLPDGTFEQLSTNINNYSNIHIADINRDGILDILAGYAGDLSWFENNGSNVFNKHSVPNSLMYYSDVHNADLNNDGYMDFVCTDRYDDIINYYINDGNQNFTEIFLFNGLENPYSCSAVDIDRDGDLDLLSNGKGIYWFENDGLGNFTAKSILTSTESFTSVVASDIDSDGDIDIAYSSSDTIAWLENDGYQQFTDVFVSNIAANSMALTCADMDNDGDIDIVSETETEGVLGIYYNDGLQNFNVSDFSEGGYLNEKIAVADMDQDGDQDIITRKDYGLFIEYSNLLNYPCLNTVQLTTHGDALASWSWSSNGIATFDDNTLHSPQASNILSGETFTVSVSTADACTMTKSIKVKLNTAPEIFVTSPQDCDPVFFTFNNVADGMYDIFYDGGQFNDVIVESGVAEIYANDGSYNNLYISVEGCVSKEYPSITVTSAIPLISVDNVVNPPDCISDGSIEFSFSNMADGPQTVFYDGGSFNVNVLSGQATTVAPIGIYENLNISNASCTSKPHPNTIAVAGPLPKVGIRTPSSPRHLVYVSPYSSKHEGAASSCIVDFDSDGDNDVIYVASKLDNIIFLENDGYENFTKTEIIKNIKYLNVIDVGDLNGDNLPDIIATSSSSPYFFWYENMGNLEFIRNDFNDNSIVNAVHATIVDIDQDGWNDILLETRTQMWWYENDMGSFDNQHIISEIDTDYSSYPYPVHMDLDSDGDLDMIRFEIGEKIWLYFNDGNENFSLKIVTLDYKYYDPYLSDLDNDGDMDIVARRSNDFDDVVWYENDGIFNFTVNSIGPKPSNDDFYVTDIDHDGDQDIFAGAEYETNILYWFENTGNQVFDLDTIYTAVDTDPNRSFFGDIDSDGDIDLFISYYSEGICWIENSTLKSNCSLHNLELIEEGGQAVSWEWSSLLGASFDDNQSQTPILSYLIDKDVITVEVENNMQCVNSASITIGVKPDPEIAVVSNGCGILTFSFSNVPNGVYDIHYDGGSFNEVSVAEGTASVNADVGVYNNLYIMVKDCMTNENPSISVSTNPPKIHLTSTNIPAECGTQGLINLSIENLADGFYNFGYNGGQFLNQEVSGELVSIAADPGVYSEISLIDYGSCENLIKPEAIVLEPVLPSIGISYGSLNEPIIFEKDTLINEISRRRNITIEDMDNDGHDEIVFLSSNLNNGYYRILIHENLGGNYVEKVVTDEAFTDFEIGDFNSDGLKDIIGYNSFGVVWFENIGGSFLYHKIVEISYITGIVVGYFNNDTVDDFSFTTRNRLSIYINNSLGDFTEIYTDNLERTRYRDYPIIAKDLDQDSNIDIVIGSYNSDSLAWYRNTGDANFQRQDILADISRIEYLISEDIDYDGDNDILLINYASTSKELIWLENSGSQTFTKHLIDDEMEAASQIHLEDINNDGKLDLVVNPITTNVFRCYLNDVNGSFVDLDTDTLNNIPGDFALNDLDLDGDIDIIFTAYSASSSLLIFENLLIQRGCSSYDIQLNERAGEAISYNWSTNGGALFNDNTIANPIISNAVSGEQITLSIVGANQCVNQKTIPLMVSPSPTMFAELADDCSNIHFSFTNVPNGSYDISYQSGQFNQVQVLDQSANVIAETGSYQDLSIEIFGCSSVENIDIEVLMSSPSISVNSITNPTRCDNLGTVVLEFENVTDGIYDIQHADGVFPNINISSDLGILNEVAGVYDSLSISVGNCASLDYPGFVLKTPPGQAVGISYGDQDALVQFEKRNVEENDVWIYGLAIGDLDGDGYLDFLRSDNSVSLYWYHNLGNGTFETTEIVSQTGQPFYLGYTNINEIVDIDGDGDMDILIGPYFGYISVLINNGEELFSHVSLPGFPFIISLYQDKVSCIDMDQDGEMDLIFSDFSGNLTWYRNLGLLNFETQYTFTNEDNDYGFDNKPIDFDQDGDIDLVVGSIYGNYIVWFENDGNQNFTEHLITDQIGGGGLSELQVLDMDLDGDLDLTSLTYSTKKLAWHENDGNMNFNKILIEAPDGTSMGKHQEAVDLDNDGDIDIVAADGWSEIYWLANDGNQNFDSLSFIDVTISYDGYLYTGDFNNDGDIDILNSTEAGLSTQIEIQDNQTIKPQCENASIPFEAIAADGVSWHWQSSQSATFDDIFIQNPLVDGAVDQEIISVEVTDSKACTTTKETLLSIITKPQISATVEAGCGIVHFNFQNVPDGNYNVYHDNGIISNVEINSGFASVNLPIGNYDNLYITYPDCSSEEYLSISVLTTSPSLTIIDILNPISCLEDGIIQIEVENLPDGNYNVDHDLGTFPAINFSSGIGNILTPVGAYNNLSITYNSCTSIEDPDALLSGINSPQITNTSATNPSECNGEGEIILTFNNVPDGIYNIDYDGGSFTDIQLVEATAHIIAEEGTYENLSIAYNGCNSIEFPDVSLFGPLLPTIEVVETSPPPSCGMNGEIILSFQFLPNSNGFIVDTTTYEIYYDGGVFSNVEVNGGYAIISAPPGTYENLYIIYESCSSIEFPNATVLDADPPVLSANATNPSGCLPDGSITFTLTNVTDGVYDINYDGGVFSDVVVFEGVATVAAPEGIYNNLFISVDVCTSANGVNVEIIDNLPIKTFDLYNTEICNGATATITLDGSEIGVDYQLRANTNDAHIGSPVAGTGAAITFDVTPTATTVFNVLATNATTTCDVVIADISTVTVKAAPHVQINYGFVNDTPEFTEYQVSTSIMDKPFVLEYGDMDQDGDIDVLCAYYGANKVVGSENDGYGVFIGEHEVSPISDGAHGIFPADLDGDDDLDVVVASQLDDKVVWYKNNGLGVFSTGQVLANDLDAPRSVYAADLDGDLDLDIVSTWSGDGMLAWYENDGLGNFGGRQIISDEIEGKQVIATDLDNDGKKDVLLLSWSGIISLYRNQGQGTFGTQMIIPSSSSYWIDIADINNDNITDILSVINSGDGIVWIKNLGGGFEPENFINSGNLRYPVSVFATDLNSDGNTDILAPDLTDDELIWFKNNGAGSFDGKRIIAQNLDGAISAISADLDGDGDQDVIGSAHYGDLIRWYKSDHLDTICYNTEIEFTDVGNEATSWLWSSSDPIDISFSPNNTIQNPMVSGIEDKDVIYVEATGPNECTAQASAIMYVYPELNIAIGNTSDPSTCNASDGSFEITGLEISTEYTVDYNENATPVSINLTSDPIGVILISGLNQGTYSAITVTQNGCTSNAIGPIVLSDPTLPTIAAEGTDPSVCGADGSIAFTFTNVPDNTYTIDYDGGSFNDVSVSGGAATINTIAGTYNKLSITADACTSIEEPDVVLTDPAPPAIALGTLINPETCSGNSGSIELTGLTPLTQYTVEYLKDGTPITPALTSNAAGVITISDLSAGIYSDIKVSLTGCTSNTIASVTLSDEENLPGIFVDSFTNPTKCNLNDGIISLSFTNVPNGEYLIEYDGGNFTEIVIINNYTEIETGPGTYNNLKITVGNCSSIEDPDVSLDVPMLEITVLEEIDPLVCGGEGEIIIEVSNAPSAYIGLDYLGGSFGRFYFQDNVPQSIPATAGTYDYISINSSQYENCISLNNPNASLSDPALPIIELVATTDPLTCEGEGSIELAFSNVSDNIYTVNYDGGSFVDVDVIDNAATISAVSGFYDNLSITVAACTSTDNPNAELRFAGGPSIAVSSISYPPNCASNGVINFTFSNVPDGNYTISYEGGSFENVSVQGQQASVLTPAGNYIDFSITVDGCISIDNPDATLYSPDLPTITIENIINPTTCGGEGTIELSFTNTPDAPNYEIFYDGGSFAGVNVVNSAAEITAVLANNYNDLYLNVGTCASVNHPDAIVSDPEKPTIEIVSYEDPTGCDGNGTITFNLQGIPRGPNTIYYDGGDFSIWRLVFDTNPITTVGAQCGEYNNFYVIKRQL